MRRALIALVFASLACPGLAQERLTASTLEDLAFVLGESHALRQACAGLDDQFWRGRMTALISKATPEPSLEGRMRERFNDGFARQQRAFPNCSPASRARAIDVAALGQTLAERLSGLAQDAAAAVDTPPPGAMAPDIPPR